MPTTLAVKQPKIPKVSQREIAQVVRGAERNLTQDVERQTEVLCRVTRISEVETVGALNNELRKGRCVLLATPLSGNWRTRTVRVRFLIGHLGASCR
jgi:hypothetical protein